VQQLAHYLILLRHGAGVVGVVVAEGVAAEVEMVAVVARVAALGFERPTASVPTATANSNL
jgi:hypothetical protein